MLSIFRALTDRLKAMFATNAALELESEFIAREAERRAELLRQADRYDAEGLHTVAGQLRQQVETLSIQQPLASVLPALMHLQADASATGLAGELFPADNAAMLRLDAPKSAEQTSRSKRRDRS